MITLLMTLIGDDPKEQERFRQFYYKYQEHMYFRARYFMRNEQDALDVMQEAFISIAKNFGKIGDINSTETKNYIMTIVENKARNELTKAARRRTAEEALLAQWKLEHQTWEQYGKYTEADIIELMLTMPEIYSGPLYMYHIREMHIKEIAEALGITMPAVRKRLERARITLKEMIGEEDHE